MRNRVLTLARRATWVFLKMSKKAATTESMTTDSFDIFERESTTTKKTQRITGTEHFRESNPNYNYKKKRKKEE